MGAGEVRSAFSLLLRAAKLGDLGAQLNLGYFYNVGIGVKPNRHAALRWYMRAYKRGMSAAASNIGNIYRDEHNLNKAVQWFERAVQMGEADANLELAKIYNAKAQIPKAIIHLQRACRAGTNDITIAGREEAQKLLKRLTKKN
jgi:uncharacterized protein